MEEIMHTNIITGFWISPGSTQLPTGLTGGALVPTGTSATERVHYITTVTAILTGAALTFVDI